MSTNAVLHLAAVTRVHGEGATEVHALRGVTFRAHPGELVAVMGPSGSGKSTLLTLAGGLDHPTSGSVWIEGTDLASLDQAGRARMRRTSVGYVFQDFNLIPALTAAENVALPLELDGTTSRRARGLAIAALEEVGIADLADAHCATLAYGDAKRLELALALAGEPRLLLMDEPTAGMSPRSRRELMTLATGLARDAGVAVLFTEHDMDIVFAFADRVLVLDRGALIAAGAPAAIKADPRVQAVYLGID